MRIGGVGSGGAIGFCVFTLVLGCNASSSPPDAASGTGGLGGEGGDRANGGNAAAAAGNGDSGAAAGGAQDCPVTLGSESPIFEQPAGLFQALVYPSVMLLDGKVLESPRAEIHDEAERSGSCRLLTYESAAFCDPSCENSQLCVRGSCVSLPEPVSAGDLTVQLSGGTTFALQPRNGAYSWYSEELGLADAETVAISAAGDASGGFELQACAFEPPAATENWDELMVARQPGEDVVLRWSNPVAVARVYLRMTTGVGTHGGISPVEIECEGPDVGSLTLPGGYLDKLYQSGWSCGECGQNNLLRYHASQASFGDEAVQLRVGAMTTFWFIPSFR